MGKGLRWCLFLFAALLLALRWPGPTALAASEDYSGSVTITFRERGGSGGGGGSGSSGGTVDRDSADPFPPDTVTVIRQEVPLSTLGPLPKTGSRRRTAGLLLFGGACCAAGGLAGLRKR